jgi:hypothetical protein
MHGGMMLSTEANSWFVHQNSLSILPGESSTSKQEEWPKGMRIWPSKYFIHTCKWFLHAVKAYDMVLPALLPLLGKLCYRLPSPTNLGTSGKHSNHCTTEATRHAITGHHNFIMF